MPKRRMFSILMVLCAGLLLINCKNKKKPLTGDDITAVKELIELFPEPAASLQYSDSVLKRKEKDSFAISYKTFSKFVPDSIIANVFGKGLKPKSFPLGRMLDDNKTNYLLMKTVANETRSIILYCFNKDENLIAAINLLKPDLSPATTQSVSIDRNFNIAKSITRKNADGSVADGKDVFILDEEARHFMLILTELLDDKLAELVNPIDTLPRKQKFSADYTNGKNNLVSVRDGSKPDRFIFFIHFEKNKGECNGELKGEATITGKNTAVYRLGGDPCVMQFNFSATSVSLKEIEGCAAHRGLRCSFDGSFAKKKPVMPAIQKKKR
jgi:hypothetical protein